MNLRYAYLKGQLNPNIKFDLNGSFCSLINKYNPHIVQFYAI